MLTSIVFSPAALQALPAEQGTRLPAEADAAAVLQSLHPERGQYRGIFILPAVDDNPSLLPALAQFYLCFQNNQERWLPVALPMQQETQEKHVL